MDKKLKKEEVARLATEFGLTLAQVQTIIIVESSGAGFDERTGKIKIQFEPAWFQKFTRSKILNGVEDQKAEYAALEKAIAINRTAALEATSFGMMQVMGFNFAAAGYSSVQAMYNELQLSEYFQVRAGLNFIKKSTRMFIALKSGDWKTFASLYNGPLYYKKTLKDPDAKGLVSYDEKMALVHARLTAKK